jgi:hypothetical protein
MVLPPSLDVGLILTGYASLRRPNRFTSKGLLSSRLADCRSIPNVSFAYQRVSEPERHVFRSIFCVLVVWQEESAT